MFSHGRQEAIYCIWKEIIQKTDCQCFKKPHMLNWQEEIKPVRSFRFLGSSVKMQLRSLKKTLIIDQTEMFHIPHFRSTVRTYLT